MQRHSPGAPHAPKAALAGHDDQLEQLDVLVPPFDIGNSHNEAGKLPFIECLSIKDQSLNFKKFVKVDLILHYRQPLVFAMTISKPMPILKINCS
jgi:hypothetical protein